MQDGWEKFWNFIGFAFWAVVIGWFGISVLSPSDTESTPTKSTYVKSYDSDSAPTTYDSYSESESYYEESEPAYSPSRYSSSYDMDCGDFDTWDDAQYHYENVSDDNLDGDGDGIACESLY